MCNCITATNQALAKRKDNNSKIAIPLILTDDEMAMKESDRCSVLMAKIDDHKRKPPIRLFASFCPFCGEKYND